MLPLQVTDCNKMFTIGSLHPIHGKITTQLGSLITKGPRRGSFIALPSQNGSHPGRSPCCGFTGNVSYRQRLTFSQTDGFFPFGSGIWEERALVS
jgi:hypothetical protein